MKRRTFLHSTAAFGGVVGLDRLGLRHPAPAGCDWRSRLGEDPRPQAPIPGRIFARGRRGMVSSSQPLATEAAICALERGGSAVDAYLTAAFAQTVLEPVMTTLAGGLGLGFFDAKSGQLYECGGGFQAPAAETGEWSLAESITARPTMVPGFVRGAEVAHKRFGKLSWAQLLEPAITFAEEGFIIDHLLWAWTYERRNFAGRYAAGRALWFPNGHMLSVGDRLRQPELALTLKRLRDEGPEYFYTGQWAKRFVAAVRDHGSRMTLEDVARFKPIMADPWLPGSRSSESCAAYRGYLVGPPSRAMFGLACNLMEAGDLRARGKPTENGDALYYQMRIMQEIWHTGLSYRREDHDRLLSKEYAQKAWRDVETGPSRPFQGLFEGTCALVIVDPDGNVAAGTHSSTSAAYGIGLFVDGVIVNRVTYGRGKDKLPSGLATNVWFFKEGKPALVVASPSRAFNEALIQNVANVVEYGMDLGASVRQPRFGHTDEKYGGTQIEGDFSDQVIARVRQRGIDVVEVSPLNDYMGSCHGVQLRSSPREIQGAADPRRRGMALGIA